MSLPPTEADALVARTEQRWAVLNAPFALRSGMGPSDGADWQIEPGNARLLVTSVHGVRHVRPGRGWKAQDARTGGLARAIAEAANWSSAFVLHSDRDAGDANFDGKHPLKNDLERAELPGPGGILFDLHGMAASVAGADLVLGLGRADERTQAVAEALVASATHNGLRVTADRQLTRFAGASAGTMTHWAQAMGAAAVQIEISPQLRFSQMPRQNRCRLVAALLEGMAEAARLQRTWRVA